MVVSEHTIKFETQEMCDSFKDLSLTATQIAIQNFEWRYVTLVYFNTNVWCGVEVFLQSYKRSAIVGKGTFYPNFADKTRQFVLFGFELADINHALNWMENHKFDNTGRYIIICQSHTSSDCDEVDAVKTFWHHKVTNVVFLKYFEGEVAGYTYFPLNNSDCRGDVPVKIHNLSSCLKSSRIPMCHDLFEMKLKNFNKCPLVASTYVIPPYMQLNDGVPSGANGDVLIILAEKLNATLKVMSPENGEGWGYQDDNGTWKGSLGDIYFDYANFSMTSCAPTLERFIDFQISIEYNDASLVWITHQPRMLPSSLKLMHPFQLDTQCAVGICFFLVFVCALVVRSRFWVMHVRSTGGNTTEPSLVFYAWMICMGLPSTRLPRKTSYLIITFLWIWFCFFLRTIYQVSLIPVLKANYYYSDFNSIDDAIKADYPFGGSYSLKDFYIDYPLVHNNWVDLDNNMLVPMMKNVSGGLEFVLALSREAALAYMYKERIRCHVLRDRIATYPTFLFFKKYSPIIDPINKILVKLVEAGFSDKAKKNHTEIRKQRDENTMEPINMKHYTGCYMVLIAGWVISLLSFFGEIIYPKLLKYT